MVTMTTTSSRVLFGFLAQCQRLLELFLTGRAGGGFFLETKKGEGKVKGGEGKLRSLAEMGTFHT